MKISALEPTNRPLRHLDPQAHEPGCLVNGTGAPWANLDRSHIDIFCDCHRFTEPKILQNGTDIAWPAGWNEEQAADWRKIHNLNVSADSELLFCGALSDNE
jgi:hypothetical protein